MKLYLDNSFLNRPFDDLTIARNKLEAEILSQVIQRTQANEVELVSSAVIAYENSLNPFLDRKRFVSEVMRLAKHFQDYTSYTRERAQALEKLCRLSPIDARHLAVAEAAAVDFFVTCDYTLLKKYQGDVVAVTPIQLLSVLWNTQQSK